MCISGGSQFLLGQLKEEGWDFLDPKFWRGDNFYTIALVQFTGPPPKNGGLLPKQIEIHQLYLSDKLFWTNTKDFLTDATIFPCSFGI